MPLKDNPIFEKKNVLVTGGAGFIGSHLCERLLREANVICMDDFSNSSIRNIEHLLQYPDFEFIKYDVTQPIDLEQFGELNKFKIRYQGVQEIYHLACPTSPKDFESLKLNSLRANSAAMLSTLDLAAKYKARYVFGSSSVVYGARSDSSVHLVEGEEGLVDHLSPRACYDEGKRFAETCVETYRQVFGIDAKIARIFPTYGPRMKLRDGLLIPDFILDAITGKSLVIYGDEHTAQSFCFISDTVDALVRLMRAPAEMSVVNVGSDQLFRIADVARAIVQMTESASQITFEPPLAFVSKRGVPDLRKAKEQMDWLPLVRMEDGLRRTVDYTLANMEAITLG